MQKLGGMTPSSFVIGDDWDTLVSITGRILEVKRGVAE